VYDDGNVLMEATRAQELEGIVSKRKSSRYVFDRRCEEWLKFPHRPSASYVVGGWRPETGTKDRLGALLVGEPTPDGLLVRGRVGSGVAGKAALRLKELLDPLSCPEHPFTATVPREDALGTVWVEPTLVVDVVSLGFTPQGRLRQPAYVGVRSDLRPEDLLELEVGGNG
jgi:bifunctional non-homologous end joining protein LigD